MDVDGGSASVMMSIGMWEVTMKQEGGQSDAVASMLLRCRDRNGGLGPAECVDLG